MKETKVSVQLRTNLSVFRYNLSIVSNFHQTNFKFHKNTLWRWTKETRQKKGKQNSGKSRKKHWNFVWTYHTHVARRNSMVQRIDSQRCNDLRGHNCCFLAPSGIERETPRNRAWTVPTDRRCATVHPPPLRAPFYRPLPARPLEASTLPIWQLTSLGWILWPTLWLASQEYRRVIFVK